MSELPRQPGFDDEAEGPDLRHYLDVVRRRLWVIVAALAIGVTATVLYTGRQIKIYEAVASVVVNPQAPQVFGQQMQEVVQLGTGNFWSNHDYYNTQIEIIASYDLIEETVREHRLHMDPRVVPEPADGTVLSEEDRVRRATGMLAGSLSAGMRKDSRIVEVRVRHSDAELAADLANAHVATFTSANLNMRTEFSKEAAKFLTAELDSASKALKESEAELAAFKRENQILSIALDDKMNLVAADLGRYTAAHSEARIKRIQQAAVRKRAQDSLASGDVLESPIFALAGGGSSQTLKTQYLEERQKFLKMREELGPRHPDYLAQKNKVDELYAAIEREARLALREIEERFQAALAAETQFKAEVDRLTQEALDLDDKRVTYTELARRAESDDENHKFVMGRLRDSQLSSRNQLGNVHPHAKARKPGGPVHPNMRRNVVLAAMLSLMMGLGLVLGLEFMDRTISSAEDVEQRVGVPLLGVIPIIEGITGSTPDEVLKERDLYVFKNPTSAAAECARSIRTNILFSGADRELKVLTLSSPNPREGKTTSVMYLGTTMAQSGAKVLLVDTDMRKPRLHKSVGVARGLGLSNLILGESSYEDVIKTTDIPNLYVLPCGPTPPNPAELLLTNRFKEILEELKGRYDRIILDSPPLQAVTDAVVLSKLSDGVILVAEAGKTIRDDLASAAKQVRDVNAHLVGAILNDLDLSDRKYGYYYYAYTYGEGSGGDRAAAGSSKA